VALDKYKTQVLLLHSEQSTLDNLRSGFTDRYTVHCATSGSEALNTLVETPINVIISAHDLPGMSGLDALREAKKRSPDTIGILLAGSKTTDINALIGDGDVFQVVSGTVTSEGLLTLVDSATGGAPLMTVSDPANDMSASVDDPAEHIIMETAENGSTIISDGTGQLPILDPKKIAAAVNIGSRSVDVLVLTKDQEFLQTIRDSSRGMHKVHYASSLGQANEAIRKHKIGVAVLDAGLAGEKIEQLTVHLRKGAPRLVSIVAGRRDDGEMLMDLINRGKVYRFLLKPVSPGRARLAVESSVKHHLEAPDATFEGKDAAAGAKPAATRKSAESTSSSGSWLNAGRSAAPEDPPMGSARGPLGSSPLEDGLADAFGDNDASFTETVTGMISSVGKKLSSSKQPEPKPEPEPEPIPHASNAYALPSDLQESGRGKAKLIGVVATVLVAVAGASFWFLSGSEEMPAASDDGLSTPPVAETEVVTKAASSVADTAPVKALIDKARAARDAGRIFDPVGNNAIEYFAVAIDADPDNSLIAAELNVTIGEALALAESAMLEGRLDATDVALQRVASVDPQNGRLPFLTAQLAQMRLRAELDAAREAIRESRFEDAGNALSVARGLDIADTNEIEALTAELNAARGEQEVDEILAQAMARLDSGDLVSPSNDNARYFFQLVLTNDADNTAARQGMSVIAGKLAYQARAEIDSGNLSMAADTLASARALDPSSSEVAATSEALETRRSEIAEQERLDEANRLALLEQQAAAERQAEADRIAEAERQAEADRIAEAERQAEEQRAAQDKLESLSAATAAPPPTQSSVNQQPMSVSSLTRTKYTAPKYPRAAERRNLSGWVDVVFTVMQDGTVADIEVRDAEPGDTFNNAAIKAVEKWEFEPVVENGSIVEKRAGVRLMFALE